MQEVCIFAIHKQVPKPFQHSCCTPVLNFLSLFCQKMTLGRATLSSLHMFAWWKLLWTPSNWHFFIFFRFLYVSHGFALGVDISLWCAGCGCYGVPCTALPNCGCQSRRHRFASLHRCAAVMQSSLRPLHDTYESYDLCRAPSTSTTLTTISQLSLSLNSFNFPNFSLSAFQPFSLTVVFAVPISRGMTEGNIPGDCEVL